jgi:prephenate dehydrogenase
MKIAVVGLGLMGGSFCKAIKKYTGFSCYGIDKDEKAVREAYSYGAIDSEIPANRLSDIDLTLICLNPQDAITFITDNVSNFKKDSIVVDICGVKEVVVSAVESRLLDAGVNYIGGHPMAGREYNGFRYSLADLFLGAYFIITPSPRLPKEVLFAFESFVHALGFKEVVYSDPKNHDEIIAFTSQLAHIVSSAYVKSPTALKERGYTAGSFEDLTRVAQLDEKMWSELFVTNAAALGRELDHLIKELVRYRELIAKGDKPALAAALKEGTLLKQKIKELKSDLS